MEFLLIVAAVCALVWTAWFILRGSLVAGCLVMLVFGSLFGYDFWHADVGHLPLTIDRLLAALLAAMYVVQRRFGMADPKPLSRAEWVLFAFLGVLFLSTFTHDWSFHRSQPVFKLVQYFVIPAVVYWVIRQSPLTERNVLWVFGVLAVFGAYVSLTALAEFTGQYWAVFPRHLASPQLEYFGRARGPLLNPAANGILITLGLIVALSFWPRTSRRGQLLLLGFTSLATAALYATLTRSAWLGGALGLALFIGLSVPKQWRTVLLGAGVTAGVVFLAAQWENLWSLKRDVHLEASAAAESVELRPILAQVAWNMFLDRPLVGCGFGQYDRERLPYLADRTGALPLEKVRPYVQHNAFLALLTETGLLGAGLFVLLLGLWLRMAWRLWSDDAAPLWMRQVGLVYLAFLGAYLPTANFHDTNLMDMLNVLLFLVGGLVSGVAAVQHDVDRGQRRIRVESTFTQSSSQL